MDSGLKIEETRNKEDIISVLKHPIIYDSITEDGCPKMEEWDFEPTNEKFLVGKVEDIPMALMIFHPEDLGWFCHVQVVPEYRKFSEEFGEKTLDWFWVHHDVNELFAEIPDKYPNVVRFAEKNGFKAEKPLDDIYIKDNITYNEMRYRLERPTLVGGG